MTALSNTTLAARIAALDWSGCSLQHQLAVAAAVETLRKEAASNVLPFPNLRDPSPELLRNSSYTPSRQVTITRMDGRPLASATLSRADRWDWIVETTCEICHCDVEQVAMLDDTVTVEGLPVLICC